MKELNKELMASSLSPIVLLILRRQESYGYEIIQQLRHKTGGQLDVAEGTLYPLLKKMEAKNWIEGNWKKVDSGKERRYYTLTEKGILALEQQYSQFNFIGNLLQNLWETPISTSNTLLTTISS